MFSDIGLACIQGDDTFLGGDVIVGAYDIADARPWFETYVRRAVLVPDFYGAKEAFVYNNGEERHIDAPSIGDGFEEEIYEACGCIREGRTESSIHPMEQSIALLEQNLNMAKYYITRYKKALVENRNFVYKS